MRWAAYTRYEFNGWKGFRMQNVKGAACRRRAGLAAGLTLGIGLAGGVLLTPGTALAATTVATTTAITGTTQSGGFLGTTTLNVQVSVTPASGTVSPSGTVVVSDGAGGGCQLTLAEVGSSAVGAGNCNIAGLHPGVFRLMATYEGSTSFGSSASGTDTVLIGRVPVFLVANPPLTAVSGELYSYTFQAAGDPAPSYSLGSGSPFWLHINSSTGTVWGTVPFSVTLFSYSVIATNSVGSATAGPYWVHVRGHHRHAAISTSLSCTPRVFSGRRGSCTLSVTNMGRFFAPDVTAQISLPSQLRALFCSRFQFNFGCTISGNTASQDLGTLSPGQTKTLSVVFVARPSFGIWGWHRFHTITVKVVGSATAGGGFFGFGGQSFSTAFVTIIPRGWWWAF